MQSCVARISRTNFHASKHFVRIYAPESRLPNVASGSSCSNVTPRAGARIHDDENARLGDGVDPRVWLRMLSKTNRLRSRPGSNQRGSPAGQQCAHYPPFFAIGVADASPVSELREYLHGKIAANEGPSQWIIDTGPSANVGRLALNGDETGNRKAAPLDTLGTGRRAERASEQDRQDRRRCADRSLHRQPLPDAPSLRI